MHPRHDLDNDTKAATDFLPALIASDCPADVEKQAILRSGIRGLHEAMRQGLADAPKYFGTRLSREFEESIRLRWDYNIHQCWVFEIWADKDDSWLIFLKWMDASGKAKALGPMDLPEIIALMRLGDMRTEGYHRRKRDASDHKQEQLKAEHTDRVMGAVDSLSTKQINQFLEVSTAIKTGETIEAHGADFKTLEHYETQTKAARAAGETLPGDDMCVNPGQNPRI